MPETPADDRALQNLTASLLTATAAGLDSGRPLAETLAEQVQQHLPTLGPQTACAVVAEIGATLDEIDQDHQGLQTFLAGGGTRAQWLAAELRTRLTERPDLAPDQLLTPLVNSMVQASHDLAMLAEPETAGELPLLRPVYAPLDAAMALIDQVESGTGVAVAVTAQLLPGEGPGLPLVADALQSAMGSDAERSLKLALSTAAYIARETGALDGRLEGAAPAALTMLADRSVTALKVAAQVGACSLTAQQGAEIIIDRDLAVFNSGVRKVCREVGGKLGERAGQWLGGYFGPVGAYVGGKIGRVVGTLAGDAIGRRMEEGGRKLVSTITSTASSVVASVCSFVGGLFR